MNQIVAIIGNLLRRYTTGQRIVITIVFIGMISAIISLMIWANRPEYSVLFSELDPSVAGKIVADLRGLKIKYKVEHSGRTISVPMENVAELRLKFAEAGYVGNQAAGYEIFDNAKIGMTTFMQRLNSRRALEGELTKTINQFPGVKNSRIHLVLPEGKLFEEDKEGSASVVLYLKKGTYLNAEQVRGIAALVSNSAKGIDPENVVVVDSDGNLLSENQVNDPVLGTAGNQWDLRNSIESKLRKKVKGIVEGIVGYQNAVVEVSVDLDFEQIERTVEAYDPDNVVVVSEERHAETSTGNDTTQFASEDVITNYELNKTKEHFISNTGTIRNLSVAVLLNGIVKTTTNKSGEEVTEYIARNNKELAEIAALVKSAVGYNEDRGDVVEVRNIQFDRSSSEAEKLYFAEAEKQAMWAGIINKTLIGLGILVAFFIVKALLKSAGGTALQQLPMGSGVDALSAGRAPGLPPSAGEEEEIPEDIFIKKLSPEARAKLRAKDKMTSEVMSYAKESPDAAAKLIRSWLTGAR